MNESGVRLVNDAGAVTSDVVQTEVSSSESGQRSDRILQNFRALFSPYTSVSGPSTSSTGSRNQSSRPPPAKKPRKGFFRVKETWTHEFSVCHQKQRLASLLGRKESPYRMQALDAGKSYFPVEDPPLTLKRIWRASSRNLERAGVLNF